MFLKTNNQQSNFRLVYPERKRRAFTLIEMLVVIVIVSSIMAMSVSVFQSSRKTKNVESVASSVRDVLMNARNQSITPVDTISVAKTLKIVVGSSKITRQYFDSSNIAIDNPATTIYTFPTGFIVDSTNFSFNVIDANKIGTIDGSSTSSFSIAASGVTYEMTIDNLSGQVSYKKV